MVIEKAIKAELPQIIKIKEDALALFKTLNDPQWNEVYPIEEDFLSDIEKGELFVCKEENRVLGFASITEHGHDNEYIPLSFTKLNSSVTFCRFAVKAEARGKGISQALFDYAVSLALEKGKQFIVTDTHESNIPMQKFLVKNGFYRVDTLTFPSVSGTFIAFEKKL